MLGKIKDWDFKKTALGLLPYVIILGLSFVALYVFFYEGLLIGDDLHFHLANVSDEYLSILNEGSISRISTYLASNLGIGRRLFYSPLFHTLAGLIYFVTHGLGGNAVSAIKVVMFIAVFVSGIFMYRFVLKATKNQIAATIAASLYVIYPYRIFDALCRAAYAEALAITFIPLFFHGLYGIVNFKDEIKVGPFIATIVGGSLLFLSHNLTAMFGFIFGVIFLLVNIDKIIKLCKQRRYWITGLISVFLLVGIMSIQLFPTAELLATGLYNISDSSRMWTTAELVSNRAFTAFNYSGFLNFPYMNGSNPTTMNVSIMLTQIISFLFFSFIFILIDQSLKTIKALKYFHFPISALVYLGLILIFAMRNEVIMATIIVIILYFVINYVRSIQETAKDQEEVHKPLYKEVDFWFLLGILLLTFALITQGWIWRIMPEPLLMIQFPWRLWAYMQFFLSWMIGWLVYRFKDKKIVSSVAVVALGFCLVTNQALPEKRLNYEKIAAGESTAEIYHGDEQFLEYNSSIGWNKEYAPQVFFQDDYVSDYEDTLYYSIRLALKTNFVEEYPYDPVALTGNTLIDVELRETPNYELSLAVTEASLIQMPLIYYPGYQVEVINEEGEKSKKEVLNIDGLIAFNVDIGDSLVGVSYPGTGLAITGYVFFSLSVLGTIGLTSYYVFVIGKKKKKDAN